MRKVLHSIRYGPLPARACSTARLGGVVARRKRRCHRRFRRECRSPARGRPHWRRPSASRAASSRRTDCCCRPTPPAASARPRSSGLRASRRGWWRRRRRSRYATLRVPLYLSASAAPAATGTDAAMALMMATMRRLMSPMCMLPSLPRVSPPTRPMYCAKIWRGWTPRIRNSARSRCEGSRTSSGSAVRPTPTGMASWPRPT